jgi:hypothetical protein
MIYPLFTLLINLQSLLKVFIDLEGHRVIMFNDIRSIFSNCKEGIYKLYHHWNIVQTNEKYVFLRMKNNPI